MVFILIVLNHQYKNVEIHWKLPSRTMDLS